MCMNNLTSELINKLVKDQINLNQKEIVKHISYGINDSDPIESMCAKMVANSIEISAQLSVKIVLELLFQSKLIEELDTKTLLKQLQSDLTD